LRNFLFFFKFIKSANVWFTSLCPAKHGQTGPDVVLSKVARKLVGVNFECKNQSKMKTIYDWYRQASKGQHKLTPAVAMKMNSREPLVVISLDDFFELIK